MGTAAAFLCALVGCAVAATGEDEAFPPRHPGFFENLFRFEQDFDFPWHDTIFSSGRTWRPDFHVLGELPSFAGVPRVEVFCDQSKLTVLVEKKVGRAPLTADELQLGDGCHSNQDLPNQHVFAYGADECGTTRAVEGGVEALTNTLWIKPRARRPVPPSVSLTCIHHRAFSSPSVFAPTHPDEGAMAIFNFRAADASWTGPAQSNIYERGQVVHLQVSVKARPDQQLFVQSCFISSSPEPHSRPRHAVVANKGCATPLGSSRPAVRFVASSRPDVVNLALNTSYVTPEPFVHCTVLVSDRGVTPGSKSCSYDATRRRWEDPWGAEEPCECCRSKCRGLSLRNVPDEAKAVLSIGPFLVVDVEEASPTPPPETPEAFDADPAQSDGPAAVEWRDGTPGDAAVASQDPAATLAVWIPEQLEDGLERPTPTQERPEAQNSVQKRLAERPRTQIGAGDFNTWVESPVKFWRAKFGLFGNRPAGDAGPPEAEVPNTADLEALPETRAGPVIRSKVAFSKGTDGSQTLSYEEEVVGTDEDGVGCGTKTRCGPGLRSKFLDLIRKLDEAE